MRTKTHLKNYPKKCIYLQEMVAMATNKNYYVLTLCATNRTKAIVMADEQTQRNFRSYYYAKVGFPGVEEKKSLEILFKENKLDEVKLAQFSIRFSMPAIYRLPIWKILLRVLPRYQSNHGFVWKIKCEIYEDFHLAILVMELAKLSSAPSLKFLKMYLLAEKKLLFDHKTQEEEQRWKNFIAIAEAFEEICDTNEEAFWLSKNFFNFTLKFQDIIPSWVEHAENILLKEDPELHRHLSNKLILKSLPFDVWFCRCFASMIPVSSLVRVWDRIIGGSVKILPYLAVAILMGLRRSLLGVTTTPEALQIINNMIDESAEVIISKAVDIWQKHGPHSNPGSMFGDGPRSCGNLISDISL